jgi:hypothetical protein
LPNEISLDELHIRLSEFLNELIQKDFEKLIRLLYRIDISEAKLKQLLQQPPNEDASKIIAQLIIERQLQKIKFRKLYRPTNDDFTEEEKW